MQLYIFSYGSLMNPASRKKTLPGQRFTLPARLRGYQRKMNALVDGFLYLNIVSRPFRSVDGVIIPIASSDLVRLRQREIGYDAVDVSNNMENPVDGRVLAFIAPDRDFPSFRVPQSYLDTCLARVPADQRSQWIEETIILNPIYNDRAKPAYKNAV